MDFTPDPKKYKKKKKRRKLPKVVVWAVFDRDSFTCQECGKQYPPERGHGLQCHHIIFVSQGGKDTPENLTTLCWECHGKKH